MHRGKESLWIFLVFLSIYIVFQFIENRFRPSRELFQNDEEALQLVSENLLKTSRNMANAAQDVTVMTGDVKDLSENMKIATTNIASVFKPSQQRRKPKKAPPKRQILFKKNTLVPLDFDDQKYTDWLKIATNRIDREREPDSDDRESDYRGSYVYSPVLLEQPMGSCLIKGKGTCTVKTVDDQKKSYSAEQDEDEDEEEEG